MSLRELLRVAAAQLHAAGSPSPRADAEFLLLHVVHRNSYWLRLHDEVRLTPHEQERFDELLHRRQQGEPVAYITGERGFWSLDVKVAPGTLIPRPETEMLVEFVLEKSELTSPLAVLDLGTGSGVIALAVKKERPLAHVTAVDFSPAALEIATENAERLELDVEFLQSDWYAALEGRRFDLLLSNPPYIAMDDAHLGQGDLRFEPISALVSGEQGLRDIRRIIEGAVQHLEPRGWLALEHGFEQGAAVRALLEQHGFAEIETRLDLSGHERITLGQRHAE
ncbi:MAG TPA: peptide chain release factor N(5)-glutamine methyltransferase [Moraxellaceae bacterium]